MLTGLLRRVTERLHLVEVDPVLARGMADAYADDAGVVVHHGDVLQVDLDALLADDPVVHVVGNLPYSIASQILLRLVDVRARCPVAVVMLQEEMARRVAAAPGSHDYGVLTLMVQLYAAVDWCFLVRAGAFAPPPRVRSAVVRLRFQGAPRAPVADPELFRTIVRLLFQHRRKMLRGSLPPALEAVGVEGSAAAAVCAAAGIDPTARPETLTLSAFAELATSAARQRDATR
jgi:16S rRNA (adenine1518-N6/adenine1519-N6)-dimethyltransferase